MQTCTRVANVPPLYKPSVKTHDSDMNYLPKIPDFSKDDDMNHITESSRFTSTQRPCAMAPGKPTTLSACLAQAGVPKQLEATEAELTIAEIRQIAKALKAMGYSTLEPLQKACGLLYLNRVDYGDYRAQAQEPILVRPIRRTQLGSRRCSS